MPAHPEVVANTIIMRKADLKDLLRDGQFRIIDILRQSKRNLVIPNPLDLPIHLTNFFQRGFRLPSARLRVHVNGHQDLRVFLSGGYSVFRQMEQALNRFTDRDFNSFDQILDFGVGCGRLERWFDRETLGRVNGVDVATDAVTFCKRTLPGQYQTIDTQPPLPFANDEFDLILSFSVFSHMDIDVARPWIAELARVTRPGAVLLITTHMEWCAQNLISEEDKARYDREGWCGIPYFLAGQHHPQYINTYYSEAVWKSLWQDEFEFLGIGYGRDANEFASGGAPGSEALLPMGQALSIMKRRS